MRVDELEITSHLRKVGTCYWFYGIVSLCITPGAPGTKQQMHAQRSIVIQKFDNNDNGKTVVLRTTVYFSVASTLAIKGQEFSFSAM